MTMEKRAHGRLAILVLVALLPICAAAQAPPTAASAAAPPPIVAQLPAVPSTVAAPPPPSADDPVATAIYGRLQQMTPLQGGPLSRPDAALGKAVSDFYAQRHFTAAWSNPTNVQQLLASLASVDGDGLLPDDYDLTALKSTTEAPDWSTAS